MILIILLGFIFFGCKNSPNEIITLTTERNEEVKIVSSTSNFEFIVTQVVAVGSVILSASLGFFYWKKQEKETRRFQNHFDFLSDINDYYIVIHDMLQDLNKYNELLTNFNAMGFSQYDYDFSKSHYSNKQNLDSLLSQKMVSNFALKLQINNLVDKWDLLEKIAIKYCTFDFFLEAIKTLNKSAYLHSFFIDKKLKREFDIFVENTYKLTLNNYAGFCISMYCEDILNLFESAKKYVDKNSNPIIRS